MLRNLPSRAVLLVRAIVFGLAIAASRIHLATCAVLVVARVRHNGRDEP